MQGVPDIVVRIEIQDRHILDCKRNGNQYTVCMDPDFLEDGFIAPFFKRLARFHARSTRKYPQKADIQILHESKERLDVSENAHDILCAACRLGVKIGTVTIMGEHEDEVPLRNFLLSLPPNIEEIQIGKLDATQNDVPLTVWTHMPSLNAIRVLGAKGLETEFLRPPRVPPCAKRRRDDLSCLFPKNPIDIRKSTANQIVVLPDGEDDEDAVSFKIPSGNQSNLVIRAVPYSTNPPLRKRDLVQWPNDEFLVDYPYQSIFKCAVVTKNAVLHFGATENTAASVITGMELHGRVAFVMN